MANEPHDDEYRITRETQQRGGYARALSLTPARRRQIAREAARARWNAKGRRKK
jgi:hypothetical protein